MFIAGRRIVEADALSAIASRSRTRGQRTATGPMPVTISRSGKCPWRTNRARPSAVSLSAWSPRKPATSASTACANSARAPLRKISVNGSLKIPGCASLITLSWVTTYHSLGGEVEAFEHPTIRPLTPSSRHQLSRIALGALIAHWETDHWAVDAVGAPHVGDRTEKELITAFC